MAPTKSTLGRILYADDDESSRLSISELLQREGYECTTANDGVQAAKALQDQDFDCVVSDIRMMGNSELEFVEEAAKSHPHMPVILVTGYPSVVSAAASLKLPVSAYLIKPIDFPNLIKEIREAMLRLVLVRQLADTKLKLASWLNDLEQLTEGMRGAPRVPLTTPLDVYLMVTYRNVLDAMLGLKTVLEHSLSSGDASKEGSVSGHTPLLLVDALRETIGVLEKTKDAFRSRDLGELRRKLETLLSAELEHRKEGTGQSGQAAK